MSDELIALQKARADARARVDALGMRNTASMSRDERDEAVVEYDLAQLAYSRAATAYEAALREWAA